MYFPTITIFTCSPDPSRQGQSLISRVAKSCQWTYTQKLRICVLLHLLLATCNQSFSAVCKVGLRAIECTRWAKSLCIQLMTNYWLTSTHRTLRIVQWKNHEVWAAGLSPIQNSLHRMYESIHLWQLLEHLWPDIRAKEPVGKGTYRDREIVAPQGTCRPWLQSRWRYRTAHSGCNPSAGKTVRNNNKSHVTKSFNPLSPVLTWQETLQKWETLVPTVYQHQGCCKGTEKTDLRFSLLKIAICPFWSCQARATWFFLNTKGRWLLHDILLQATIMMSTEYCGSARIKQTKSQNDMPSYKNNTNNNYVFSNDWDMEPVIKEIAYSQQKRYMPDVGYIMNVENVICLCITAPKH